MKGKVKLIGLTIMVLLPVGLGWYMYQRPVASGGTEYGGRTSLIQEITPLDRAGNGSSGIPEQARLMELGDIVVISPPEGLDNSDAQMRFAVLDLAPELLAWLVPDEQIRKWVLLVDLMADGGVPRKYRPVEFPVGRFKVNKTAGRMRGHSSNFMRAEPVIKVVTGIEPPRLAKYFRTWNPMLNEAYAELGKEGSFELRLQGAIDRILKIKPLETSPDLTQPMVVYKYADPALEQASDLDKFMWRLGSVNLRLIQDYLRQLNRYL
jgi:hypothetical protein